MRKKRITNYCKVCNKPFQVVPSYEFAKVTCSVVCANKYRKIHGSRRLLDLTGKKFGRLLVIAFDHNEENYQRFWKCLCDCGNTSVVHQGALSSGNTVSCGCYGREATSKAKTTHGGTKGKAKEKKKHHPLYGVWSSMKSRCYHPSAISYKNYGGRGIDICNEWRNDFVPFRDWCLENGWKKGLQIDRINNDKGYYPGNCRIVTPKVNGNNTRATKIIEYKGVKKSVQFWAEELGIKPRTLYTRIYERHYPIEKAFMKGLFSTNGKPKISN